MSYTLDDTENIILRLLVTEARWMTLSDIKYRMAQRRIAISDFSLRHRLNRMTNLSFVERRGNGTHEWRVKR